MTKPYSNSARSKVSGRYGGGSGMAQNITQGANLETLRYQNQAALPTQSENDAQLFADIGKNFSAPGDRPRGALRNLGAGLAKGAEYGLKSRAISERKDNYDKYENVMNYLQEVNNAAIEQNQWYEKRENARKEMMPQVISYMDNIDRLDPQSRRFMAQDILAQYGDAIGENFKLSSIDGTNPYLMTIQSDKGQQLFDLRSLFAGDEAMQQAIAMKMPEYQMRLQEERQMKEREFALKQKDHDLRLYKEGIPGGQYGSSGDGFNSENKIEIDGQSYETVPLKGRTSGEITDYGKLVNKNVSQIKTNEQAIQSINDMRQIFERNPEIGQSMINMMIDSDESSWSTYLAKQFFSKQERADMEILKKAASDLNLSTVLSVPGKSATDILKKEIKSASPSGTLTKIGFDKIANQWEQRAISNISMANAMAQARAQNKMIIMKSPKENPLADVNESDTPDFSDLGTLSQ